MADVFAAVAACMGELAELSASERGVAIDALLAACGRSAEVRKPIQVTVETLKISPQKAAPPKARENPGRYRMSPETQEAIDRILEALEANPQGLRSGDLARQAGLDPSSKEYNNARQQLKIQNLATCSAANRAGVWTLVQR